MALKPGTTVAQVLAALYNAFGPLGSGYLSATHAGFVEMTPAIAQDLIDGKIFCPDWKAGYGIYFDYLFGRLIKTDLSPVLSGDEPDWWGYDRDNGPGAGHRALADAGLIA